MRDELEILKAKVRELEGKQATCNHDWNETESIPEKRPCLKMEIRHQGSDSWFDEVPTGSYEFVPCWARVCKKCGKVEKTYEQEDVVIQAVKRPKF